MTYTTVTGRVLELGALSTVELAFLDDLCAFYRTRPEWTRFAAFWPQLGRERLWGKKAAVGAPLYRICQDLEARLGIAQGKVAAPDYRDMLLDLIDSKFESRAAFCRHAEIDPGQLSRVLAGKGELSVQALYRALAAIGMVVLPQPAAHTEEAAVQLGRLLAEGGVAVRSADVLAELTSRRDMLRNLLALARRATPAERAGLLEESLFGDEEFAPLAARLRENPEKTVALIEQDLQQRELVLSSVSRTAKRLQSPRNERSEGSSSRTVSA